MISINKCISVKVYLFLIWLQSSWKLFEAYLRDGSEQKNLILDGTDIFAGTWVRSVQVEIGLLGGSVFPTGTFYPSTNYVTFIMANWYRYPNFDIPKMGNIHFITLTFSFSDCFLNLKVKNTYCQVRKPSKLFKTILKYHKPVPSRKLVY